MRAVRASTIARWYDAARSAPRASALRRRCPAYAIEQRGLQPAEAEVELAGSAAGEVEGAAHRPLGRGCRWRAPRDSPARAGVHPCRRPRPPRRRASGRARCSSRAGPPGRGRYGRRWPPGTGRGTRSARRPACPPPRARADGRQGSSGSRRAAASALAEDRPTSSAPISPDLRCYGHGGDLVQPGTGLLQGVGGHGIDQFEMVAGGDLGHHAAVARVQQALRGDHVGPGSRPWP